MTAPRPAARFAKVWQKRPVFAKHWQNPGTAPGKICQGLAKMPRFCQTLAKTAAGLCLVLAVLPAAAPAQLPPGPTVESLRDLEETRPSAATAAALLEGVRQSIPDVPLAMKAEIRVLDRYGKPLDTIRADALMNPRGAAGRHEIRYTLHDPEEAADIVMAPPAPVMTTPDGAPLPAPFAPIRGSEICWMELSFAFFWWGSPRLVGSETIPNRGLCHILEIPVPNPAPGTPWDRVRLWVHPGYRAVLRGEVWSGSTPLKRFDVLSVRRLRKIYMIGEMEVRNLQTDARSVLKITDLRLQSPEYTEEEKALFNAPLAW